MITVIIRKKDKKQISYITQQYEVGLYLAVYTEGRSLPEQGGINTEDETGFHRDLRKGLDKRKVLFNMERSSKIA